MVVKNMKRKKINNATISVIANSAIRLIFFFSLIILMAGSYTFLMGFHNTDTCVNMRMISLKHNLNLYEMKLDGTSWDLNECYRSGMRMIINSFYTTLLGVFFLGTSLMYLNIGGRNEN